MQIAVDAAGTARADVLVGLVVEEAPAAWLERYGMGGSDTLTRLGAMLGGSDNLTVLAVPGEATAPLVCLAGIGRPLAADASTEERAEFLERFRMTLAVAMAKAASFKAGQVSLAVDSLTAAGLDEDSAVHEAAYAMRMGLYQYKGLKHGEDAPDPEGLILAGFQGDAMRLGTLAVRAEAEAEAVCLAKDLVNTPANLLPPLAMADKARELCSGLPLTCTVLDREALHEEGLNALLAVGRGSANEPVLIRIEYIPQGQEEANPLVLVGKGLAFDSGGISLKPSAGMHEMKSDMAGAAAVLAVMTLVARVGGRRRVVGLLPCAENMPDGLAMRPGDVIRTMKGTTVEVLNTDAEGRLVLCDALTYAQKHWKPEAMVDIATLTGACVVALGTDVAGLFATDDVLAGAISTLGLERGERFWRMPLWNLYAENIKSPTADLANVGPREGGAVNAAVFLKHFVDVPWAHLDIAGPAFSGKKKGSTGGGTGFGVRTLAALAL